ncbi:MAG TPA: type I-E CRISPR-associated protein Cas6/Cse3/CasE [Candidatus Omnitrophota bacterium]|nr:type I-E CRISPR-associated protein Cas6/Cse3/CasE [Candidatus Omnitrophota bacterium]HQO57803.1 type I-E CRISPR-associated protein Cas6/Cse3/CasE [Candidatus Omnitrophota bacterium]
MLQFHEEEEMYISRITLKEDARQTNKFWDIFNNEYSLHQAVWDLFGDKPDRERDFLYRMESLGKYPVVYTVSKRRPEDRHDLWNIESKDYDPKVKKDMRLGFALRVNPTRKRDGKRHDVVMDRKHKIRLENDNGKKESKSLAELVTEACLIWLKERSEKKGFQVLMTRAEGYRQSQFLKKKGGMFVRYSTVDFSGMLQVLDEHVFRNVLFEGLGPGKGFGCGLMLVRKS